MPLFWLPSRVKSRLEKNQRDFLWGGGSSEKKLHLVNWEIICSSKERGGMGIRSLFTMKRALLGKWVWRFSIDNNSPKKNVISLRYSTNEGGWFTRIPRGIYGVEL